MVFLRGRFESLAVCDAAVVTEALVVWVEAEFGMLEDEAVRADEGCGREEADVEPLVAGPDDCLDLGSGIEGRGPVG